MRKIFNRSGGEAGAVRQYGWERVWLVLSQQWLKMIGLNLLYVACCLPVFTIPAATGALHRVTLNWVRSRFDGVVSAFFQEFRTDFLRRTGWGLVLLLIPLSLPVYPLILRMEGGCIPVFLVTVLLYFCFSHYFYPLVVLLDVPVWANVKNAFAMAVLERRTTLMMLATAGVLDALLLVLTAYAAPLFLFFLCSFNCLVCCAFFNRCFAMRFEGGGEEAAS